MKILITGAAGFIGSALVKELAHERMVYALVKPGQDVPRSSSCKKIELDLNTFPDYHKLPDRVHTIIHLAQANVSFPEEARRMFNVNILSTQKLLDYGRKTGITGFIFASSGSIYGSGTKSFKETDAPTCPDYYSHSKYASELLVHQYREFFNTMTLRLFFPYGPGQQNRLIPGLIKRIESGQPVEIFNEGNPRINPLYISDLMEVFKWSILNRGNLTLNVGGTKIYSIREISEVIAQIHNKEVRYEVYKDQHKSDLIGNIGLLERIMEYSPRVDLPEGIQRMRTNG